MEVPKGPSTQESYTLLNIELLNYYPKPKYLIIGVLWNPYRGKMQKGAHWKGPGTGRARAHRALREGHLYGISHIFDLHTMARIG